MGCDNTQTKNPKCKHLLLNFDKNSALTDEDLIRKVKLFKAMLPEKKYQFLFICIEARTLHALTSWIVCPRSNNKSKQSRSIQECYFAFQKMIYLFSEYSAEFQKEVSFPFERKALPVGCINSLIFYVFAHY